MNNEKIYFSTGIIKYNRIGLWREWNIVLTEMAMYVFKKNKLKERESLSRIEAITKSNYSSEFVVHIENDYDYWFLLFNNRAEIIGYFIYIICNVKQLRPKFKLYNVDLINLNNVMTAKNLFKSKKVLRPDENQACLMSFDEYQASETA